MNPERLKTDSISEECFIFPTSFAQQRLCFLEDYEPNTSLYNIRSAIHLQGPLKVPVLEKCLQYLINRHATLRTTFRMIDGDYQQIVAPIAAFTLPNLDLSNIPSAERDSIIRSFLEAESQLPFNLASGPLMRAVVLHQTEDDHILVVVFHHVISDGWSMRILYRELAQLYNAFAEGQPSPLVELGIQYADYVAWQRERLKGNQLERQISFWRGQLDGAPVLIELPLDRPRSRTLTHNGCNRSIHLNKKLTEHVKAFSRNHHATLFMTLMATFQVLLHRYTGQSDIVVGSPIAGRIKKEFELLIGPFINTLVLRAKFDGNPTFAQLLSQTRATTISAFDHQELPFEKLVEELQPVRHLNHSPIFQVMFTHQNLPSENLTFQNIVATPVHIGSETAKFDLTLTTSEADGALQISFNYNTDLFDHFTIERMVGHFQVLLEAIVANPDQPSSQLPLLTETERDQLLVEWNDTESGFPKDQCVHQLFEEHVEKTPDSIALIFEDQHVTYRELNNRANQLARYLQKLGVGPEVLVGLCLERSIEMVVGLLGILKAGGAYVPLDPDCPKDRLAFMLQDFQAKVLLAHSRFHNLFASHTGARIALDLDWTVIANEKEEAPTIRVTPKNLAYVIYTSGSTGSPKGVAIQHGALCNHMHWLLAEFPMSDADRVLLKTPHTFDASVWEIFAALQTGAQLVIARPDGHKDSRYLVQTIIRNQITVLQLVPSLLNMLLQESDLNRCTSLRYVFCGGEKLPTRLHKQFSELMHLELINLYGPTEACIDATYWRTRVVTKSDDVPIGKPITNTQIYILDGYLNPVPIGLSGELHIGGAGLARGYLNRPELTQEKFIANPFSDEAGSRLYKTGDLGRYLPDGNIEFLGRIDNQVKIRGYRIELGEIETVLAQHPAIQQVVVLAREDTPGDKRLVAYAVTADGSATSGNELRGYLQQKLPDYMLPSAFIFLDSFPLNTNGKLDRKALPAADQSRPALGDAFVAPRTTMEEILANIWAKVLKLDKVGIQDNFFHLGGHSLLATQVVSRIRNSFSLDLPLRSLFDAPTIEGLAKKLQELRDKQEVAQAAHIAPVAREQYRVQKTNVQD